MWLSIDPGFTRLGYALWDKDQYVESGVIGAPARIDGQSWVDYVEAGIRVFNDWEIFARAREADFLAKFLDHVVFEQIPVVSASANFRTSPQIPLVYAAIATVLVNLFDMGVPTSYVAAVHWKKVVFGQTNLTKARTRRIIFDQIPEIQNRKLTQVPFDETDAIGIGLAWISEHKQPQEA